jgi:hypothetical protein
MGASAIAAELVAASPSEWRKKLLGKIATTSHGESGGAAVEEHEALAGDIDAILERLDQGIAAEQVAMDKLLERMVSQTPR